MSKLKQTGFTIVELLIAMVISLTLIFACTSVYSSLQNSISTSQNLSIAQESLRTAHYLMSRSVRQGWGIELSGATPTELSVVYGTEANDNVFFGCLGTNQTSGAKDTFYIEAFNGTNHLFCTQNGNKDDGEMIALNVTSLSASLATGNQKGVSINLKIDGMPGKTIGTLGVDGITFILALRQRILINAGVSGASSTSEGLSTNL